MLEMKTSCERCGTELSSGSTEARICSYECTFCARCSEVELGGKCPNCGGDLLQWPSRA